MRIFGKLAAHADLIFLRVPSRRAEIVYWLIIVIRYDAKLALVLLKSNFFFLTWQIDFLKIRHKNVEYFNLVYAQKPKLWLFLAKAVPTLFLALRSSWPVYVLSLLSACHILSGCRKKFGVNYGQSLEMGPWSIIGIRGHFITIFTSKVITLFSNLLRQNALCIQKRLLGR